MTITEKTAYLKGLLDGMKIDRETDEGKLFAAIIDTLDDIALSVSDIEDTTDSICDELDLVEEALDEIDEDLDEIYDALDDDCDCDCDCCCDDDDDEDEDEEDEEDDDEDDEEDEEEDWEDEDGEYYEVVCSHCGETLVIDEAVLRMGSMKCPNCGGELEFEEPDEEEEETDAPAEEGKPEGDAE